MAKSLRSKTRVRARNQKRLKWAPKEKARLERIAKALNNKDVDMSQLVTVKTAAEIRKKKEEKEKTEETGSMDVDVVIKARDPKTLKDEDGHYPAWMNQRAVKKHKQKINKIKKVKSKGRNKKGAW